LSDFITNGASVLPAVKSDVRVPTGGVGEWAADDSNQLRQAALDLRSQAILEAANLVLEQQNRLTGDALIIASGVTPSNVNLAPVTATGTLTARTIADWQSDVVNVKAFGAVGDGTADDTAAIQAAINYAQVAPGGKGTGGGKEVFLPAGAYKITGAGLTVSNLGNITFRGAHKTWFGGGTQLVYTGTGNAISINGGQVTPTYRIRLKDFGISFTAATVTAGIYMLNVSEVEFTDITINGSWATGTLTNGFDIDGAGIAYFTGVYVQQATNAFNIHGGQNSQSSGISLNKCNLFWVENVVKGGNATYVHVYDCWIEAFKAGIAIDSNYYYGAQMKIDIRDNFWNQSWGATTITNPWASSADARVLAITSSNLGSPVYLRGSFVNNTMFMKAASTSAGPATYANSCILTGNSSVKDIDVSFSRNRIYGVTTAGVYADTTDPIFRVQGNEVTTEFWLGTPLPEVAGASTVNRFDLAAEATFTAQAAGKIPLVVHGVTAQSANLQEWKNATGTTVASVEPDGTLNGADLAVAAAYSDSYQAKSGNAVVVLGNETDGAGSVGAFIGPQTAFSTDGSKLLVIRHSNVEKAFFNSLGGLSLGAPSAAWTTNAMYSGTGAPNNSYGSDGDFYFRRDGGAGTTIYHKRTGTWTGIT
jgi:hypothetical protein